MSFVPQEANWSAQSGTSAAKKGLKPKENGPTERSTDLALRSLPSRTTPGGESPTMEIIAGITEAHGVIVVAVTVDQELRDALAEMLPKGSLVFADSVEQVVTRPAPSHCGVLIVEHSLRRPLFEQVKSYLKTSAPALVNIMVGSQDDGSTLIGMLSAGSIDRFMVKPFRAGSARNALRSALQAHRSLRSIVRADQANAQLARTDAPGEKLPNNANDETSIFERVAARKIVVPTIVTQKIANQKIVEPKVIGPKVYGVSQLPIARVSAASVAVSTRGDSENELTNVNDWVVEYSGQSKADKSKVDESSVDERGSGAVKAQRKFSPASWGLAFAAVIAVIAVIAIVLVPWRMFARTAESNVALDVNKVIAGHLSAANRAFQLGSYVEPPELSAAHFYAAALELDPKNRQAKQGLDAVADRLLADGKKLIVAGELLSAQSALDSVRRIQPDRRELTDVMASLLAARESERVTLKAAQVNVGQATVAQTGVGQINDETSATVANAKTVATVALFPSKTTPVIGKPPAVTELKPKKTLERPERLSRTDSSSIGTAASALVNNAPTSTQLTSASVASTSSPNGSQQLVRTAPIDRVPDEVAVRAAAKIAAVTNVAVSEPAGPSTIAPNAARPASTTPATIVSRNGLPSFGNSEFTLTKYVPPVFPYTERTESHGGWLDVQFVVTGDGSVVNPSIKEGDGTLGAKFHRAALAAVTKWKFAPAPNSIKTDRQTTVRITFRLAE